MLVQPLFTTLAGLVAVAATAGAADVGRHRAIALERRATPVSPTAPGPGNVFRSGQTCTTTWTAATSKKWDSMSIDLMTGANKDMVKLTNVASGIDGTSLTTYSWTCPEVSPNAPIYFYQFTDKNSANPTWTTRFTIASDSGATVAAPNANQPEGDAIPWGTGQVLSSSNGSSSSSSSSSSSGSSSNNTSSSSTQKSSASSTSSAESSSQTTGNSTSNASAFASSGAGSIARVSSALLSMAAVAAGSLLL